MPSYLAAPALQELEEAEARFRDHMSHSGQQKGAPTAGPAGRWESRFWQAPCRVPCPNCCLNAPSKQVNVNQRLEPPTPKARHITLCLVAPVLLETTGLLFALKGGSVALLESVCHQLAPKSPCRGDAVVD